jgi:hypothetical protein
MSMPYPEQATPGHRLRPVLDDGFTMHDGRPSPTGVPVPADHEPARPRTRITGQSGPRTPRFSKADFFRAEGPRGAAVRATVWLRHAAYLVAILLGAVIAESALSQVPNTRHGGMWLLGAITVIYLTATAGTIMFPEARSEILDECRHYVFGITLIPGLTLAILMWASHGFLAASSDDVFARTLGIALPILYVTTVLIPCILFVRLVAGRRYFNMSRGDNEVVMRKYTRQDHLQN